MCSGSYGREKNPLTVPEYRPAPELKLALEQTFRVLSQTPRCTNKEGRRLFGTQHWESGGRYVDLDGGKIIDVGLRWKEQTRLARGILRPRNPEPILKHMSVTYVGLTEDALRRPWNAGYEMFNYTGTEITAMDEYDFDLYGLAEDMAGGWHYIEIEDFKRRLSPEEAAGLTTNLATANTQGWQPRY